MSMVASMITVPSTRAAIAIDIDGRVQSARVLRSFPMLDTAALTAVGQWSYTPTLLNGVPVPRLNTS